MSNSELYSRSSSDSSSTSGMLADDSPNITEVNPTCGFSKQKRSWSEWLVTGTRNVFHAGMLTFVPPIANDFCRKSSYKDSTLQRPTWYDLAAMILYELAEILTPSALRKAFFQLTARLPTTFCSGRSPVMDMRARMHLLGARACSRTLCNSAACTVRFSGVRSLMLLSL